MIFLLLTTYDFRRSYFVDECLLLNGFTYLFFLDRWISIIYWNFFIIFNSF